ncbi:hypothetical protein P2H44_09095 [Albimonas sp. CAU 1670]|uniref:hypothetical protein n=1 Tax=Albimonas sp. CAU 1670 TaxID=3032599 RepID=UPI0023DCCA78|nr:hypothetical protein [Albimonas sp. CAU 1670]MDF2232707.1 hypothetical protein [Albimonas sp. CAU 1670]
MTRFSLFGAAVALLGLASPAAALTLDLTFNVVSAGAAGSSTSPFNTADQFHVVVAFDDPVASPVVVGGAAYQPISSLELFAGSPHAVTATPANASLLGWRVRDDYDDGDEVNDYLEFEMLIATGDMHPFDFDDFMPTGLGQSGTILQLSFSGYADPELLDGEGPEQFLKLDQTVGLADVQFLHFVSEEIEGELTWTSSEEGGWYMSAGIDQLDELASPVPIPAAGLLLPGALAALTFAARRRR